MTPDRPVLVGVLRRCFKCGIGAAPIRIEGKHPRLRQRMIPRGAFFGGGEIMAEWKWRYSRIAGVMYGPIPVGIIVVAVGFAIYWSVN